MGAPLVMMNGQGGIRTLETVAGLPVFETGSFNHSDTCPGSRCRGHRSTTKWAGMACRSRGEEECPLSGTPAIAHIFRMPLMSTLRRHRSLHLPSLLWFLFLTFDVGGVHQCVSGHHASDPAAPSAAMEHHHGMPMPASEHTPTPTPASQAPCDCLSNCCSLSVLTVPTPGIVALNEQFRPALPPGHAAPSVVVSVPSDLLPYSRPPPTLL